VACCKCDEGALLAVAPARADGGGAPDGHALAVLCALAEMHTPLPDAVVEAAVVPPVVCAPTKRGSPPPITEATSNMAIR